MVMRNLYMDHLGDGRSTIAQCVLIAVGRYHGDIENSWSKEQERYNRAADKYENLFRS